MTQEDVELLLLKDEMNHITEGKSEDYKKGFEDAGRLLKEGFDLLMSKYFRRGE